MFFLFAFKGWGFIILLHAECDDVTDLRLL